MFDSMFARLDGIKFTRITEVSSGNLQVCAVCYSNLQCDDHFQGELIPAGQFKGWAGQPETISRDSHVSPTGNGQGVAE